MDDIEKFAKAFIKKDFRERFLFVVNKRRDNMHNILCNYLEKYIEKKYLWGIHKKCQSPEWIIDFLISEGAPKNCTIVSEHSDFHKKNCLLADAIQDVFYGKHSSIVICIPDKLAYHEAEEIHDRYLIMK